EPAPEQKPCPVCGPPNRCPSTKGSPAPKPTRFFAGAGVGAFLNVAPEPFFAPRIAFGWRVIPSFGLELDVTGQAWMTANPKNGSTAVDVETAMVTLAGCRKWQTWSGCALLSGGVSLATGLTRRLPLTDTRGFLSTGLRLSFEHVIV